MLAQCKLSSGIKELDFALQTQYVRHPIFQFPEADVSEVFSVYPVAHGAKIVILAQFVTAIA